MYQTPSTSAIHGDSQGANLFAGLFEQTGPSIDFDSARSDAELATEPIDEALLVEKLTEVGERISARLDSINGILEQIRTDQEARISAAEKMSV